MTSTVWRDGYGTMVEVWHGRPEVCPDGQVRTWHDVTVTGDEFAADSEGVAFRISGTDLAELGSILQAIAAGVTP